MLHLESILRSTFAELRHCNMTCSDHTTWSLSHEMLYLVESLPKRCLANQFLRIDPYITQILFHF